MNQWQQLGPLAVAVALMVASALGLERGDFRGSGAFAAAGFVALGIWMASELHDRWHDHDSSKDEEADEEGDE
jgi:NaMN:DMB phosphoribosyltransferase